MKRLDRAFARVHHLGMEKEITGGAAEFEPPKYLASLIAAINDGAKAAQGGALAFLLVGIYLLATAFSSSDEDLLLGKTVTISQIGASLPVGFSFAIAPLVFVFVHLYTLVRYDMLATNARYFVGKLRQDVPTETDREDCRQLLANVEFLAALTAPRGSGLYSRFWPWLFRGIIVVFPVAVLLLVQVNALRYQSDLIIGVQRAALALDLAALTWFFRRNSLDGSEWPDRRLASAWRWAGLIWWPAVVLALNFFYLNLVRYDSRSKDIVPILSNPLDTLLCPGLNWGCRYLRVDQRTLVDHVWESKAMADLRAPGAELAKALAGIEGLVLRYRSLRFAVLNESRLYAADLEGADLRGASLSRTKLLGATLASTNLQDANLRFAQLRGANLFGAQLQGANLGFAQLQGANLFGAQLQGADLRGAGLQGADLRGAGLQGADLRGAGLQGADLSGAGLQGADLRGAGLQGADLSGAGLQGADLRGADLQGANLQRARLWHVNSANSTNFALGDLRGADFDTALTVKQRGNLRQRLEAVVPSERLERVLSADEPSGGFDFVASGERPVLVSAPSEPALARHPDWLITEPTAAYTEALSGYLASELASTDPIVAASIANSKLGWARGSISPSNLTIDVPIACRLLSETMVGRVRLEQSLVHKLSGALKDAKQDCPAAPPAVSETK
jgi:uncharacterized protein YjbI with pentapeptide repeats